MWAIGVVVYVLLGGYPPFHDDRVTERSWSRSRTPTLNSTLRSIHCPQSYHHCNAVQADINSEFEVLLAIWADCKASYELEIRAMKESIYSIRQRKKARKSGSFSSAAHLPKEAVELRKALVEKMREVDRSHEADRAAIQGCGQREPEPMAQHSNSLGGGGRLSWTK